MGVNRHKEHIVVILEDKPYRDIMNGVTSSLNVKNTVIDIKNPCGGWSKVFEEFEKNIFLLNKYPLCSILLLMDFDDKTSDGLDLFHQRMEIFREIVPKEYVNRVFLLGANHKESEALKRYFTKSNFEEVGKILIEDCPNGNSKWNNTHLECNLNEINRMQEFGIFNWVFTA